MTPTYHRPARRILHTSDLHLTTRNDPACQSFESIINLAIKSRCDILLIAGDFFDSNRVEENLLDFVRQQLWRIPIPVAILPGNHDCLMPDSVYERNGRWHDNRNVHIFRDSHGERLDLPDLGVSIWGRPIDSYNNDVRPLEYLPRPVQNGTWNIAIAHGFFVRSAPLFPCSYAIYENEIAGTDWDYVALGHVPVFECVCNNPAVYYSGSPQSGTAALVDLSEESGIKVTRYPVSNEREN